VLQALAPGSTLDVVIAGCGPAGIHLASVMARKGINVGLVGKARVQVLKVSVSLCERGGGSQGFSFNCAGGGGSKGFSFVCARGKGSCGPADSHLASVMARETINMGLVGEDRIGFLLEGLPVTCAGER
jgi:alkyl hydroperoxide reductase subunit AhpF